MTQVCLFTPPPPGQVEGGGQGAHLQAHMVFTQIQESWHFHSPHSYMSPGPLRPKGPTKGTKVLTLYNSR